MILATQQYIRKYSLEAFQKTFKVKTTQHPEYPELYHFHYDMINSLMVTQEAQECRALILNSLDNWNVVCHGYNKFFNYGEGLAAKLDWNSVSVWNKVDGTLINLFFYKGRFHICTTGTPDGGQFAPLFWKQYDEQGCYLPDEQDVQLESGTWMFEYVSPETRIVVPYKKPHIYFHGCRNNITDMEDAPEFYAKYYNWDLVEKFPLTTLENILNAANTIKPSEQEGFVLVDKDFNRLKVKSPLYVALHHLKSSFSPRALLDVARKNEISELLVYFPDIENEVKNYQQQLLTLSTKIMSDYFALAFSGSRKEFAIKAIKYPYSGCLFALLDKKVNSASEWLRQVPLDKLVNLIEDK